MIILDTNVISELIRPAPSGACARFFAEIAGARQTLGRPISQFDAQIAAIAGSRKALLATRDISDFADCGLKLLNPWASEA
jgi:predicted nucleic acid-binding protein